MKFEDIPQQERIAILAGESFINLKETAGYKNIIDYLHDCANRAQNVIVTLNVALLTPNELQGKILENQARIKIYNEILIYIESTINLSSELKLKLLDQDNGGKKNAR